MLPVLFGLVTRFIPDTDTILPELTALSPENITAGCPFTLIGSTVTLLE
jgi:hypothetical protein